MNIDELIETSLRKRISKIDDDNFTRAIVDKALEKKDSIRATPFTEFTRLIFGLICAIISSGILLLYYTGPLSKETLNFDPKTLLILVVLSLTFLLYTFLTEILSNRSRMR